MSEMRNARKTTGWLDIVYLALLIGTFAVAGYAVIFGGPSSWFHQNQNEAVAIMFGVIGLASILNVVNSLANEKIWAKSGPVYKAEHPKLFAIYRVSNAVLACGALAGAIGVWLYLPKIG